MKAVRFHELGGPEVLRYEDAPDPIPGPGQVLIRVNAAGVNYADVTMRYGKYFGNPTFPTTPGLEASGIIEAVGDGVTSWHPGDPVMVIGTETYAERIVANADSVYRIPEGVSMQDAASLPINFFTAWGLLHDAGGFEPGHSVLITAAAGGVGSALIQLVKQEGGRPLAIVGSAQKRELVRALGADAAFSYRDEDWPEQVRSAVGGDGADLMLDGVGDRVFRDGWKAIRPYGRAVVFGAASLVFPQISMKDVIRSHKSFTGFYLPTMLLSSQKAERMTNALYPAFSSGRLKPLIGGVYPLSDAVLAHHRLESRQTFGKLLLTV